MPGDCEPWPGLRDLAGVEPPSPVDAIGAARGNRLDVPEFVHGRSQFRCGHRAQCGERQGSSPVPHPASSTGDRMEPGNVASTGCGPPISHGGVALPESIGVPGTSPQNREAGTLDPHWPIHRGGRARSMILLDSMVQ
jgi:hypothetical protein